MLSLRRVSASFYFHANKLSAWQASNLPNNTGGGLTENGESLATKNEGEETKELKIKIPEYAEGPSMHAA